MERILLLIWFIEEEIESPRGQVNCLSWDWTQPSEEKGGTLSSQKEQLAVQRGGGWWTGRKKTKPVTEEGDARGEW